MMPSRGISLALPGLLAALLFGTELGKKLSLLPSNKKNAAMLFSPVVFAGNYVECSANYCENDGQCLVMSGSPSPFDAYEEDFEESEEAAPISSRSAPRSEFEASPIPLDFRRARQFCRSRRGRLARVAVNGGGGSSRCNSIIFIQRNRKIIWKNILGEI